ncbi:solute carrier family 2, facilitated glucose transporter member 1 [Aplysia californica]|uniref:Solute carrier family 2, facilitated glucose transporter member 1 n=1 Tax=Aplysia californica TaxID=6500 RepID=A0ABM0JX25_APLCA|nr:solute carrier family 2, facilitated glucose transporter member 1 [Aplysia californica]
MEENEARITGVLLFSITISCLGNSFLYGYQIGVVNQPSSLIQTFYNKTYYERRGGNWDNMVRYDDYLQDDNVTDAEAIVKYNVSLGPKYKTAQGQIPVNVTKRLMPEMFGADMSLLLKQWELTILWATTVAAFVLFGMIGAFSSAKVADFFGRKRGMIVITFLMFIAALLGGITLAVKSPECLILSRVLVGLHSGLNITLCPLYLTEISPKKIRGAVGTCHQLAITIGIMVSQILGMVEILGTATLWPYLFAFNAVPALLCLVCMPMCPESPRFLLIKKGEEAEARKALVKFRGSDNVSDEMEEMRLEASKSMGVKNYSLKELLTAPDLRMPVVIACVLQISQQWSGINAVMSYSAMLFELVSIPHNQIPYIVVATGVINVLCTIVAVPLMEKAGRRPLLLYPTIVMLFSFLIMTIFLNLQDKPDLVEYKTSFAIVCIIVMHTYIIGFALGMGPIPFIVVGEIFRQEPRAAAMSISLAFNWVCNFILMLTFPFLQEGLEEFVYILFMVVLVIAIVFIFFFVPETKNKTFDEIANSISLGGRARGQGRAYGVNSDELAPMDTSKV